MEPVNQILMMVLCTMIGFGIGNAWGKATMKHLFSELLNKLTEGLKLAANKPDNNTKER